MFLAEFPLSFPLHAPTSGRPTLHSTISFVSSAGNEVERQATEIFRDPSKCNYEMFADIIIFSPWRKDSVVRSNTASPHTICVAMLRIGIL